MSKLKLPRIVWILLAALGIGLVVWWVMIGRNHKTLSSVADGEIVPVTFTGRELEIEVVKSPATIEQGLSGRAEIGSDGMLFVLGRDQFPRFWMKEMLLDLDLVWMRDGRVVEITRNVPKPLSPTTPLDQLPLYVPNTPVNQVLEIPAGQAANWGVSLGDQLEIR